MISENTLIVSDEEGKTSEPFNKGGAADSSLLKQLFAIYQKL